MYMMFNGLTELQEVENLGLLNTSKVQNMHNMFYNCGSLSNIGDVKSWNVSNVVTMISMFSWNSDDWSKQNRPSVWTALDLSSWNTANVRSIYHMFAGCYTLTEINLTGWKTENVSNMAFLFYDCKALTTIKGLETWDTSNVITMQQTFDICNSVVTLDLSGWNTANVTDMRWMFSNCNSLTTIYVGDGWNTDKVPTDKDGEDMSRQMFGWCNVLNANCNQQNSDANNDYVNKTYAYFGDGGYLTYKSASQA